MLVTPDIFSILLPLLHFFFPFGEFTFTVGFAFGFDLFEEFFRGGQIGLLLAPLFGELALKGILQHRLPVRSELLLRFLQALHAMVQLAEQFFDFFDDAVLGGEWGDWDFYTISIVPI
jgi:hypothetical protein